MKGYRKPQCACGYPLKARRSEYWRVTRAITADGKISEKTLNICTTFDDSDYEIQLICTQCGNTYEGEYDDHDRVIKGNPIKI